MAQNKVSVIIDGKEFVSKEAATASKSLTSLGNTSEKVSKLIRAGVLTAVATSVAGIVSTIKIARSSLEEAAKMEQIDTSFNVLIGNAEKAREVLSDLREFSAATPLQFETIATGAQNLMAFGVSADDVLDKMRMLGNVSQGQEDKLESVVRAYGKIRAKGKASLEELNMMTEAGIPILQGLADNLRVSTDELFKMVSGGRVGFTEVDEALQAMTTGTGQFAGMLEKQASTFSGLVSTYKDNIALAMDEIGQSMLPAAKTITEGLIGGIQRFRDSDAFDSLKTSFTNLGTWITDVVKEGGPFNSMVSAFVKFVAWSVNMIPKIGAVFTFIGTVIGITAEAIQEKFQDTWDTFTGFLDDLGLLDAMKSTIDIAINFAGDTLIAIKKGASTGDWSDFWSLAVGAAQFVIAIGATIKLASMTGKVLWSSLQQMLSTAGFTTEGVLPGLIALASIGIAVVKAMEEGDWAALAADVVGALTAALIAGGLTKSLTAGSLAFSVALNFEIGSSIADAVSNAVRTYNGTDEDKIEIENIIASPEGLFSKWGVFNSARLKLVEIWGNQTGQEILAGLGYGLEDIEELGATKARDLLEAVRGGLDSNSPSKEFIKIGEDILAGLAIGTIDAGSIGIKLGEDVLNATKDVMGIHSPSTEGEYLGQMFLEGLLAGFKDPVLIKKITDAWDAMMNAFKSDGKIDVDAEVKGIMGTGGETKPDPPEESGGGFIEFFKSIWEGIKGFIGGIKDSIEALSSFKAIVGWSTTILTGVMNILGPIIDDALAPMVGILKVLGQTLGKVIAPVFRVLGEVVSWLAEGFVWFYNKAIVPVGNFMMDLFAKVGNFFIGIINGVISAINWIPGVNIKKVSSISTSQDALTAISLEDLASSGSSDSSTYTGGTTGSNTSVQQLDINVYQYYNAPIIGEGGLEQVGGFVVRAIQEYIGVGGTVEFIKG